MIKDKKDRRVEVRMSDLDYEYLHALAFLAGMTVSQYLRVLVNGSVAAAKAQEIKGAWKLEDVKTLFDDKLQQ